MTEEAQAPSQGTEPTVEAPQAPPEQAPQQAPPETPQGDQPTPSATEGEQGTPVERVVPAADGYTLPEGTHQGYGEVFNKMDLTQDQADSIIKMDAARTEVEATALRQAGQAHIDNWGDVKDTNLNLAKRGMEHFDPTGQLKTVLNETGYGNDPRLLEMFFQFGQRMEEGGFLKSEVNVPQGQRSAADVLYGNQEK